MRCAHCGKPAGLLHRYHAQCRERHDSAIAMVPTFFTKILASQLPADRFSQLLSDLVQSAHLKPNEFKSMCVVGFGTMIDNVLRQRLLSSAEERRILELKAALALNAADIIEVEDKLLKAGILRDLVERKNSDRVAVSGPMPIKLLPNENVLWIFNRVRCYRPPPEDDGSGVLVSVAAVDAVYMPTASLGTDFASKRSDLEDGSGDLVVTNLNLYFLSEGKFRRIPLVKMTALHSYRDGIKVTRGVPEQKTRIFVLDDPWFASNLVALAGRHALTDSAISLATRFTAEEKPSHT